MGIARGEVSALLVGTYAYELEGCPHCPCSRVCKANIVPLRIMCRSLVI